MVNDISRAFAHARAEREVYVQLPEEDYEALTAVIHPSKGTGNFCDLILRTDAKSKTEKETILLINLLLKETMLEMLTMRSTWKTKAKRGPKEDKTSLMLAL